MALFICLFDALPQGWRHDRPVPRGWKARRVAGPGGRAKDLEYLSPAMEVLPGTEELLAHLQATSADK